MSDDIIHSPCCYNCLMKPLLLNGKFITYKCNRCGTTWNLLTQEIEEWKKCELERIKTDE
jgi:hypothetical protein